MSDPAASPPLSGKPTATDLAFIAFLIAVLAIIVLLGRLTYDEGVKTNATKERAEALVRWMAEQSPRRDADTFEPTACALPSQAQAPSRQWANCRDALQQQGGPLAAARNAFTGKPVRFVSRCDPADRNTVGEFVIEKLVPTPPGSALPVVVSPLADQDGIEARQNLRISVCDKGGYTIRVAETEF